MVTTFAVRIVAVLDDRKGISAVEYAVLAAAVLGAVGAILTSFSSNLPSILSRLSGI